MVVSCVSKNKRRIVALLRMHKAFLPRSEGEVGAKMKFTPGSGLPHDLFYVLKGQSQYGTNLINRSQKYYIQFLRKHSRMVELGFCYTEMPIVLRCFVL